MNQFWSNSVNSGTASWYLQRLQQQQSYQQQQQWQYQQQVAQQQLYYQPLTWYQMQHPSQQQYNSAPHIPYTQLQHPWMQQHSSSMRPQHQRSHAPTYTTANNNPNLDYTYDGAHVAERMYNNNTVNNNNNNDASTMGHVGKSRLVTRSHMSCVCGNKQCVDIAMQRVTMIDGVHVDLSNAAKEVLNKTMAYFGQQANKKSKLFINIDHYPLEQRHIVRRRGDYRCVDYVTDDIILPTQTIKDRQRELAKITYLHNKHGEILKQYSDAIVGKTEDLIISEKNLDELIINSAGCESVDTTINNVLTNHEGVVSSSSINAAHNTVESTHATGDNNNSKTISNIYNNNDDDDNTNNTDEIRTPACYNVTRSPFLSPNNRKTKSSHNMIQLGIAPRNIQNTLLSDDANDDNDIMFDKAYDNEWELDNNNNDGTSDFSANANSNDIEIGKSTIPNIMNRLPKKNKLSLTSYPEDRYLHYYLDRQLKFTL